jgi:hypothetical protein
MMTYHAFFFDYDAFDRELKPILKKALRTGQSEALETFIDENRSALFSIQTGERLPKNWRKEIHDGSPVEYGEIALTKYFEEAEDNLVMGKWTRFVEAIEKVGGEPEIALGETVGSPDVVFDPTRQGSYFQSPRQVKKHLKLLNSWLADEKEPPEELLELQEMFQIVKEAGKGLYVKFI